jgi:hypothetical protein
MAWGLNYDNSMIFVCSAAAASQQQHHNKDSIGFYSNFDDDNKHVTQACLVCLLRYSSNILSSSSSFGISIHLGKLENGKFRLLPHSCCFCCTLTIDRSLGAESVFSLLCVWNVASIYPAGLTCKFPVVVSLSNDGYKLKNFRMTREMRVDEWVFVELMIFAFR